jgi:hypothetical protein
MIDLEASNHTGRELELMLAGKKPLAMFYAEVSELPWEELIPEKAFSPYVQEGRFVRVETDYPGGYVEALGRQARFKYVFFAPFEEVWRIRAIMLLKQSFQESNGPWNEALERIECSLLGYSKEETDAWCMASPILKRLNGPNSSLDADATRRST